MERADHGATTPQQRKARLAADAGDEVVSTLASGSIHASRGISFHDVALHLCENDCVDTCSSLFSSHVSIPSQYRIHSALEPSSTAPSNRLPGSDCLACRLTGFAAMSGLGAYSFVEAYRLGTFRRAPLPAGVKARPLWGASLVVFGAGCIGAGVIRLGM